MSGTSHDLLVVEDATISYPAQAGPAVAVRDATFSIGYGERVAIVGESGSGKTTLALAIAGLLTAPGAEAVFGRFEFDGSPVHRSPVRPPIPYRTPGMSMVFQNAMVSLDPVAPIGSQFVDVLRGLERIRPAAARARAAELLRSVGLADTDRILRLRPYELSGGMRQRVMLALAVCSDPRLLIADEPTSALDAAVSREVMDLLRDMTDRTGAGLLVVSHDIELCRMYVDRVVVMYRGEIVDICRADRIESDATHRYTLALTSCVPTLESARADRLPTLDDTMLAEQLAGAGRAVPA
ncbi:ABC transporter ATP-binding protein [Pseudonocardia kongjuensis]|uniref:ABC transporter ATP-binding protein n=1 Tax=Pseudonocardia kongjuensis TaxID=102227 RepID=A0ABP4ISC1_9PSEU